MSTPGELADEVADVRSLNALAETWRTAPDGSRRFVPNFDPRSGGTSSRVLVLMQSPGPQTIAAAHTAICSEDNRGPTSAAFRAARVESGLARNEYLRWNLIPWAPSSTPTRRQDIEDGRAALAVLLEHLPGLNVIVTYGTTALDGVMRHLTLAERAHLVPVIAAPHPSPANGHHRAEQHARSVQALRLAAEHVQQHPHPGN
ncbi:uracil-DNA glycosylase family protein [Curtobacterium sp. A7_M15]|uniref:uracil-DNA glycosylase family protein n=1 Tax=Curtobacterium sp. A7_M15 TaxID=3065241 RepID=UPI0027379CD0|nr:uracil-DNA glycosylase family protein [Curtobacterium sp. A7_M15]MDP4332421.1 uracil-DNA glycosylase family protein [Curtobacterium sp. A7_M15]